MAIKLLDENKSIKEASSKEEFLTYLNDDEGLTDMTHDELRDFYLGNNPNAKSNVKELADDFGISYETACEWIKEYFSESVVKEATGSNYVVKRLVLDVAARDEEHARKLNDGLGAPGQFGGSVFHELMKALEKCGYEMAGDQISVEDDLTDVYKDNDYEFFSESCKEVTESESDEYKSYRDKWNKNYKGKNRSRKEVDDFITSAWNELNHGENRFTGDEFKQLCKDAGVDANKFMKESSEYPSFDEYMSNAKKMGNKSYDKFLKLVTRDNYTKVIDWTRKKGLKWDDVSYYVDNHPEVFDGMVKFSKSVTESFDANDPNTFKNWNYKMTIDTYFSHCRRVEELSSKLSKDEIDRALRKAKVTGVSADQIYHGDLDKISPEDIFRVREALSSLNESLIIKESFKEGNEFYVGWNKTNIDDFYKYLSSHKGLGIYKHDDGKYYMGASKDDSYSHAIENDGMNLIKSDERFKDKIFNESAIMEVDYSKWTREKEDKNIDLVGRELTSAGYKVRKGVTTSTGYPQVYFKVQDGSGKVVTVSQNMSGPMNSWRYLSWIVSITDSATKDTWTGGIELDDYDTTEGLIDIVRKAFDYRGPSPEILSKKESRKYLLNSLKKAYGSKLYYSSLMNEYSVYKDAGSDGSYTELYLDPWNSIKIHTWNATSRKWVDQDTIIADGFEYGVDYVSGKYTKEYIDGLVQKVLTIIPIEDSIEDPSKE